MSDTPSPADFGRVEADGTVYVRIGDTERSVGQIPDSTPEEALSFYVRRFQNLEAEVSLLGTRVEAQTTSPEESRKAINALRTTVKQANAVGDLASLERRLDALEELLPAQIEARKAARAEQNAQTVQAKEEMVARAEQLAQGSDWRGGVEHFRVLLEQWKQLPRVDKTTDNELWHRFSTARTQYTRRRKAHFTELNAKRDEAKAAKERIIAEAEPYATSTDWGATAGVFRDLMARWKAAGSARRDEDDALWKRFRAIQDEFFDARTAAQNAADGEQADNLAAKQQLLTQVNADLDGVTDVERAKAIHREFLTKFNELGHVPRSAMRELNDQVRSVADHVSELEAEQWRRTDPQARKRAEDTVSLFQTQVDKLTADLEAAQSAGDQRKVKDVTKSLETYQAWLDQAKQTFAEFEA